MHADMRTGLFFLRWIGRKVPRPYSFRKKKSLGYILYKDNTDWQLQVSSQNFADLRKMRRKNRFLQTKLASPHGMDLAKL